MSERVPPAARDDAPPGKQKHEDDGALIAMLGVLNRTADVRGALAQVLEELVRAMGLETGWIVLRDPSATDPVAGRGYVLAAHHNLPAALSLDRHQAWERDCPCETHCSAQQGAAAYNEDRCPRLAQLRDASGDLPVHASAPLESGGRTVGVLNVASREWTPLDNESLAFLQQAGRRLGDAVVRGRIYDNMLAHQLDEQAVMLDLSQQLLGHGRLDVIMSTLLQSVRKLLDAEACALVLSEKDASYLHFFSAVGWQSDPVAEGRRVRASDTCSVWTAMETREAVMIEDLEGGSGAEAAAPWVRGEDFRGHLVVPLLAEGRSIGALVVNMRTPHAFADQEVRFVQLMANTAALAIETSRLQSQSAERARIEHEMGLAREIQNTLLPGRHVVCKGWDIARSYRAANEVGGDFFDVIQLPGRGRRVALVMGDVSGKSISGALLMAVSVSAIREAARTEDDPVAVLHAVNRRVLDQLLENRFVTAFYGVLDANTGLLRYCSAGHTPPIHLSGATGELRELPVRGMVLGMFEQVELMPFEVVLDPGDTILLYTDGIPEAFSAQDEIFGDERLFAAVAARRADSAAAMKAEILNRLARFTRGCPPSDDVTLLVVRRLPADLLPSRVLE